MIEPNQTRWVYAVGIAGIVYITLYLLCSCGTDRPGAINGTGREYDNAIHNAQSVEAGLSNSQQQIEFSRDEIRESQQAIDRIKNRQRKAGDIIAESQSIIRELKQRAEAREKAQNH